MISGAKLRWVAQSGPLWMISPRDTQIVAEVEALVLKGARCPRKSAQRQIGFARFELQFKMSGIQWYCVQAEPAAFPSDSSHERGEEEDRTDIGDQHLKDAIRGAGVERRRGCAKTIGCDQEIAEQISHLGRPRSELHRVAVTCVAVANDQWIAEMRPKSRQNLDRRLGGAEYLCRPR